MMPSGLIAGPLKRNGIFTTAEGDNTRQNLDTSEKVISSHASFVNIPKTNQLPNVVNPAPAGESALRGTHCRHFVERTEYVDILSHHFRNTQSFHGATSARVLLWGTTGIGKRQIVSHFAREHAKATGKDVLWVEGVTVETFVRDYRRIFEQMTGSPLSESLDIFQMLRKVRCTLEELRNKWFLVLFDVTLMFITPNPLFDTALVDQLPDWGHILATTSQITIDIDTTPQTMSCALTMRNFVPIRVFEWVKNECEQYFSMRKIDVPRDFNMDDRLGDPSEFTPLMTAISCSNLQHLGLKVKQYRSFFRRTLRKASTGSQKWFRSMSPVFSTILSIAWSVVQDLDAAAIDVLVYLSATSADGVPLDLLRHLKVFKNSVDDRLSHAVDLLSSMSLAVVSGDGIIRLHGLVKRFLDLKIQHIHGLRYAFLVCHWIVATNEYLIEQGFAQNDISESEFDAGRLRGRATEQFWQILPHIQTVTRAAFRSNIENDHFIFWLRNIARLMNDTGVFHADAYTYITRALIIRGPPSDPKPTLSHIYKYIDMKELKIMALMKSSSYRAAGREVRRTLQWIESSSLQEGSKGRLFGKFRDYDIEVSMETHEYCDALKVLHLQDMQPYGNFEVARRHHWIAKCLRKNNEVVMAVKHSHVAMGYWSTKVEKWTNQELLKWVDEHSLLLLLLGKHKGALHYMKSLLGCSIDLYPLDNEKVWAKVYNMISTYCLNYETYDDAEALMIDVLSKISVEDLSGSAMVSCLRSLSHLAEVFRDSGRDIEAEALYRHNVFLMTRQVQGGRLDRNSYEFRMDRIGLLACLQEQGKDEEFSRYRWQFLDMELDDDIEEDLRSLRNASKAHRLIYDQAYMALEAGHNLEWVPKFSSEDHKKLLTAEIRFGRLKERLESGLRLSDDLDIFKLSKAKKSRILHCLGLDVVYGCFVSRQGGTFVFPRYDQSLIPQHFAFCECRRGRKRSQSLSPVDLIEKKFVVLDDKIDKAVKTYTQRKLTGWATKTHVNLNARNSATLNDLPGVETAPSPLQKQKLPRPDPLRMGDWGIVFIEQVAGIITCIPGAFDVGEHENESYIIPNALEIPVIKIHIPKVDNPKKEFALSGITIIDHPRKVQKLTDFFPKTKLYYFNRDEDTNPCRPIQLSDILEDDDEGKEWQEDCSSSALVQDPPIEEAMT